MATAYGFTLAWPDEERDHANDPECAICRTAFNRAYYVCQTTGAVLCSYNCRITWVVILEKAEYPAGVPVPDRSKAPQPQVLRLVSAQREDESFVDTGLCDCTAATPCPRGRVGSEPRCRKDGKD